MAQGTAGRVVLPGGPAGPGGEGGGPAGPGDRSDAGVAEAGAPTPTGPAEAPELKPVVEWQDLDNAKVEFDQPTYDYFRSADAQSLAESVKTTEAQDANGKVIGLQITGSPRGRRPTSST